MLFILLEMLAAFAVTLAVLVLFITLRYRKSTYYQATKKPYLAVVLNKGSYGEYLIYRQLRKQEKKGAKFLFNVYLEKEDGETTECDVLMLSRSGIFVFESKNYSGWIFGDEKGRTWTQSLPRGKGQKSQKEHFLNPVFQNALHIRTLKRYIGEATPVYSVVVFSDRCVLKKVTVTDPLLRVVKREQIQTAVSALAANTREALTKEAIDELYDSLYPFTQVSEDIKAKHIENIQKNHA